MGKNRSRNNKPVFQPPKPPVMKQDIEMTSEEKEKLIEEGKRIKGELIAEGEKEKTSIIERCNEDAKKIVDNASKEAKKIIDSAEADKDKVLAAFKAEVKEIALIEAEDEKAAILSEVNELKANAELKIQELELKHQEVLKKSDELEKKMHAFLVESAQLETAKLTYKTELLSEFRAELDTLNASKIELTDNNISLSKELSKAQKIIEALNEDKLFLEEDIESNLIRRQEVMALQSKIEMLSAENQTINRLFQECKAALAEKDALLQKYGENPNKALEDNLALQRENKELRDRISNCPSEAELLCLREIKQNYEAKSYQYDALESEYKKIEDELQKANVYKDDLENHRRFIKVLELQKSELQKELDRIIQTYSNRSSNVFASLSKIDKEVIPVSHSKQGITLKDLCTNFRNYLASRDKNPLYYSEQHIRTFIAAFASTRLMILEGMSGTGKSSLPKAFMEYVDCVTERIPVQSSWKDRNDLLGFYNDFEKRFKETEFLKALYRATRDSDNIHCIVLDEMNLSRIEYYFADLLSVLEDDEERNWKINLISDNVRGEMPEYVVDGQLQVCSNTWFIGTANNDDSTQMITDKVYDRAIVLNFKKREDSFKVARTVPIHLSNAEFQALLAKSTRVTQDNIKEIQNIVVSASKDDVVQIGCPSGILS